MRKVAPCSGKQRWGAGELYHQPSTCAQTFLTGQIISLPLTMGFTWTNEGHCRKLLIVGPHGQGDSSHPWICGVAPSPHTPTQKYRAGAPSWLNKFSECDKHLESRRSMCQLSVFWGWASLTALATKHSPCWQDWMWADFSTAAIYVSIPDAALHWKPLCGAECRVDSGLTVTLWFSFACSQILCA